MCNCGKKRTQLKQPSPFFNQVANDIIQQQPAVQKKGAVMFEYTGKTALTVTGSVTRKNYRFNFPGDKQLIEFNDAGAMIAVPVLKKII